MEAATAQQSPLRLWSAIRVGLAFQLAITAIAFVRDSLGSLGILASAAVLGPGLVLALGGATFRRRAAKGLGVLTMVSVLTLWLTW